MREKGEKTGRGEERERRRQREEKRRRATNAARPLTQEHREARDTTPEWRERKAETVMRN